MQLSGDAKLLDALFVTHDASSGALAAVDLATAGTDGTFASIRLDARRRRAITERTLAEHRGGVPRPLIEEIAATLDAAPRCSPSCTPAAPRPRSTTPWRAVMDG